MTITRLRRIVDVIRLWSFFKEGILYEAKYLRYDHSLEVYRRILFSLVRDHQRAWVAVASSDDDDPLAFVLAHEVTPLHAEKREFEVSMFYYRRGNKAAIRTIQDRLDAYCRENGIHRYYLTTSSFCSTAERVFKDSWRGLERSNTVFKREI
jgi:hypothetical protein